MSVKNIDPEQYARDSVMIEPLAIQEEFVRVPSDIAHWNGKYADALRAFLLADMQYDETKAKLHLVHRERLLATNGKATVDDIKAAVETDPALHQARLDRIEAEVEKQRTRGMVDAVGAKKESLISLGAQLRKEMDNDPVIRAQHANAHTRAG